MSAAFPSILYIFCALLSPGVSYVNVFLLAAGVEDLGSFVFKLFLVSYVKEAGQTCTVGVFLETLDIPVFDSSAVGELESGQNSVAVHASALLVQAYGPELVFKHSFDYGCQE